MLQWLHLCNGGTIRRNGKSFNPAIILVTLICQQVCVRIHSNKRVILSIVSIVLLGLHYGDIGTIWWNGKSFNITIVACCPSVCQGIGIWIDLGKGVPGCLIGIMLPLRYQFNRAAISWNGEGFNEAVFSVSSICQGIGVIIHFDKGVVCSVIFIMFLNS